MEAVTLMLADEHPLIQVGFRGRLRLGDDLEVEVVGVPGEPPRRRILAGHKHRALMLIAAGFPPSALADRLGICLERAEALHEELTRNMGLDRIARQVRWAVRSSRSGFHRKHVEAGAAVAVSPVPAPRGDRMMDNIDLVRSLFPEAQAQAVGGGEWAVVIAPAVDDHRLGEGRSESEAWTMAAARLSLDDWFRPIIAQLRAMRAERGTGA